MANGYSGKCGLVGRGPLPPLEMATVGNHFDGKSLSHFFGFTRPMIEVTIGLKSSRPMAVALEPDFDVFPLPTLLKQRNRRANPGDETDRPRLSARDLYQIPPGTVRGKPSPGQVPGLPAQINRDTASGA